MKEIRSLSFSKPIANALFGESYNLEKIDYAEQTPIPSSKYFSMRPWQKTIFLKQKLKPVVIVIAPGGAGKSFFIIWCSIDEIINEERKQIIIVPLTHTESSYRNKSVIFDETKIDFDIETNCCRNKNNTGKKFKEFLRNKFIPLQDKKQVTLGSCLTSHVNFIRVMENATDDELMRWVENTTISIDEFHHSSYGKDGTKLGKLIDRIMGLKIKGFRIRFYTATPFRGDNQKLISDEFWRVIPKFVYPFSEYIDYTGIEKIHYKNIIYESDTPLEIACDTIRKFKNKHHLIILPALKHSFRINKHLSELMSMLKEIYPEDEILDWVTKKTQDKNKALLEKDPKKYRVVVACYLFNESTDWPPCDFVHNMNPSSSMTRSCQIFCRALRKYKGKKTVWEFNYIRNRQEKYREYLSDLLNATIATMQISSQLFTVNIKRISFGKKAEDEQEKILASKFIVPIMNLDIIMAYGAYSQLKTYIGPDGRPTSALFLRVIQKVADKWYEKSGASMEISKEDFKKSLGVHVLKVTCDNSKKYRKILKGIIDAAIFRNQGFDKIKELKEITFPGSLIMGTDEPISSKDVIELEKIAKEILKMKNVEPEMELLKTGDIFWQAETILKRKQPIPQKNLTSNWIKTNKGIGKVLWDDGVKVQTAFYKKANVQDLRIDNEPLKTFITILDKNSIYLYMDKKNMWVPQWYYSKKFTDNEREKYLRFFNHKIVIIDKKDCIPVF